MGKTNEPIVGMLIVRACGWRQLWHGYEGKKEKNKMKRKKKEKERGNERKERQSM